MNLSELVRLSRSYRRFQQHPLDEKTLVEWLRLARLCPSAANRQPLKYLLAWRPEQNAKIFPHLRWAAALAPWPGPGEGERPVGYIVILSDNRIGRRGDWDCGIAAQTILLAAAEQGWGGCMIGSVDHPALQAALALPNHFEILLVLALGKPGEIVEIEEGSPDKQPYWRDQQGVHHVPKRPLRELRVQPPGF